LSFWTFTYLLTDQTIVTFLLYLSLAFLKSNDNLAVKQTNICNYQNLKNPSSESEIASLGYRCRYYNTGWAPKKVSHYQMIKKLYYTALKPANKIRCIRQIKV